MIRTENLLEKSVKFATTNKRFKGKLHSSRMLVVIVVYDTYLVYEIKVLENEMLQNRTHFCEIVNRPSSTKTKTTRRECY